MRDNYIKNNNNSAQQLCLLYSFADQQGLKPVYHITIQI